MNSTAQLIITLVAVVAAAAGPVGTVIGMAHYLGGRIDRLGERVSELAVQAERTNGRIDLLEQRMEAGFERLERALAAHAALPPERAHARP